MLLLHNLRQHRKNVTFLLFYLIGLYHCLLNNSNSLLGPCLLGFKLNFAYVGSNPTLSQTKIQGQIQIVESNFSNQVILI